MTTTIVRAGLLVDGTERSAVQDALMLIHEGRIANVQRWPSGYEIPRDAVYVDASQLTILPGLINCHSHYASQRLEISAQQIWQWPEGLQVLRASEKARSEMRLGVTVARDAGAKGTVNIVLKRAIEMGIVEGPRMVVCGQLICTTGGHGYYMGREVDGPDEMRRAVREMFKLGADFIKLVASGGINVAGPHPVFPWDNHVVADTQQLELTEEEIRVAVEEAHKVGRRVAAHAHGLPGIEAAIRAGVDSIEHGIWLDERSAEYMAAHDISLVPTLSGIQQYVEFGPRRNLAPFVIERAARALASLQKAVGIARNAGVRIATGTDNSGEMRLEIEQLASVGLSNAEAIRAATRNGAVVCGVAEDVGTLEVGKWGDLVGVSGNPLERIDALRDVRLVLKSGRLVAS